MKVPASYSSLLAATIAAVSLLSGCGGAKNDASQSEANVVREGADPEGKVILLTAKESEAMAQSQAQQEAAFRQSDPSKSGASSAFKADAVANQIRFVADFDGDGKDDILWQTTTGASHISFMNDTAVDRCSSLGVQTYRIMGTGDFNGDGKADIVWRNMSTGAVRISLMDGGVVTSWLSVGASPIALSVKLEAVGDFDGNGRADMLWRNQSTGRSVMSYHDVDGSVLEWPLVSNFIALTTNALKVGDINGDGKDDIVWRNMGTGNVVISLMNGNVATWRGITASPIALSVALEAVGDFDNNGRADLLWRNTRTGNSLMSFHNEDGSVASWPVVSTYINPTSTSAQGVGDFDGDGKDDILWRNLSSGNAVISIMNGNVPAWVGMSFSTCPVRTYVPHTGVTANQCYGGAGDVLQACTVADVTALSTQQDGHRVAINALSYRLVPRASGGSYARSECVMDNVSGLVWEGKTADNGPRGMWQLFTNFTNANAPQISGDWVCEPGTYVCEQLPDTNPSLGQVASISNSVGYVNYVNTNRLCGYDDWRLPTRMELFGLLDFSRGREGSIWGYSSTPLLKTDWFVNTPTSENYMTSTPDAVSGDIYMWSVDFNIGQMDTYQRRADLNKIRLVRGQ